VNFYSLGVDLDSKADQKRSLLLLRYPEGKIPPSDGQLKRRLNLPPLFPPPSPFLLFSVLPDDRRPRDAQNYDRLVLSSVQTRNSFQERQHHGGFPHPRLPLRNHGREIIPSLPRLVGRMGNERSSQERGGRFRSHHVRLGSPRSTLGRYFDDVSPKCDASRYLLSRS